MSVIIVFGRVKVKNDASNAWTMLGEIVLLKKCTLESHYR